MDAARDDTSSIRHHSFNDIRRVEKPSRVLPNDDCERQRKHFDPPLDADGERR